MARGPTETIRRMLQERHPEMTWGEILADAFQTHGTYRKAAQALGVSEPTYREWREEAGLERRVIVIAPPPDPEEVPV